MKKLFVGLTILVSLPSFAYEGQPRTFKVMESLSKKVTAEMSEIKYSKVKYCSELEAPNTGATIKVGNITYTLSEISGTRGTDDCLGSIMPGSQESEGYVYFKYTEVETGTGLTLSFSSGRANPRLSIGYKRGHRSTKVETKY